MCLEVTSGAPATSNCSVPFLSRSSNWILCNCVKLARCVGYKETDTDIRFTVYQSRPSSIETHSTYVWAFVRQITDALLGSDGQLYWYHPARLSHTTADTFNSNTFKLYCNSSFSQQRAPQTIKVVFHHKVRNNKSGDLLHVNDLWLYFNELNELTSKLNSPRERIWNTPYQICI